MRQGRSTSSAEISPRSVGKALMSLVGLGIASGVALIAGTNMIMSRLFPEQADDTEEEKNKNGR